MVYICKSLSRTAKFVGLAGKMIPIDNRTVQGGIAGTQYLLFF